jgi:hypothetical protein
LRQCTLGYSQALKIGMICQRALTPAASLGAGPAR